MGCLFRSLVVLGVVVLLVASVGVGLVFLFVWIFAAVALLA